MSQWINKSINQSINESMKIGTTPISNTSLPKLFFSFVLKLCFAPCPERLNADAHLSLDQSIHAPCALASIHPQLHVHTFAHSDASTTCCVNFRTAEASCVVLLVSWNRHRRRLWPLHCTKGFCGIEHCIRTYIYIYDICHISPHFRLVKSHKTW